MLEALRDPGWSVVLLGLGALMLALWSVPRLRPWVARRLADVRAVAARPKARRSPGSALETPAVRDVARDAEELARHLAAQIDAKAERLERLIRLADDRLAALEQAAAEGLLDAPTSLANAREPKTGRVGRAIGGGAPSATLEADPVTRRVHELADEGRSPREIALTLGEHVGKVQLILALRG